MKDAFLALPVKTQAELMAGQAAFVDKYLKAGKCKEIYFDSDMQGGVSIWEVESNEEGARLTLENPASPFMHIDGRPIVEWDVGMKLLTETLGKLAQR